MTCPQIQILLAVYNGAAYLPAQLDSLFAQTCQDWQLLVRDDGSSDGTARIVADYKEKYPSRITVLPPGSHGGPTKNFEALLSASTAPYIMFCDQDDVWFPSKVEKSLELMRNTEAGVAAGSPVLVHSDLTVADRDLKVIARSFWEYQHLYPWTDSRLNRLVMQNVVTGCTMMINRPLASLAMPFPKEAVIYDWWIALVCAAVGHSRHLDSPELLYRQHGGNSIGAKRASFWGIIWARYTARRREGLWQSFAQARALAERTKGIISEGNAGILSAYDQIEGANCLKKRYYLFKYGFKKCGFWRNVFLWGSI